MRSFAFVGEAGMVSFSGLDGLEGVDERCSSSLATAATEVEETGPTAGSVERAGELADSVDAIVTDAALLNMPRMAARELLTEDTCESGRLVAGSEADRAVWVACAAFVSVTVSS